ncbi:MAG: HEAT repeat domain-containing protein [Planctomycetota bacterium]|jgi:hypothetical protein
MKFMVIGVILGLAGGLLAGFAMQPGDESGGRGDRRKNGEGEGATRLVRADNTEELKRLQDRIDELEALLAASQKTDPETFAGITIPRDDKGIDLLWREFEDTGDLDRLIALMEALLLQGKAGYPRLTQLVLKTVMMGMGGRFREEDALQRLVPAFRMAMRHEKQLVGYVGYLISNDKVPEMMRTPALGAAMFLSMNGVKGTEEFGPKLLEIFMAQSEGSATGGLFAGEQGRMLIDAMGMLKQKESVDPMLRMLADPKHANQSHRLVEALGRIGDPRAVGPLVARLEANAGKDRWWSPELSALGRIGTPEATGAAERYLDSMESNSKFFNQAGRYLRQTRSPRVVEMMRARFRKDRSSGNLWSTLYGLRQTNTPESRQLLEEIANESTNDQIRSQAQNHLAEIKKMAEGFAEAEAAER